MYSIRIQRGRKPTFFLSKKKNWATIMMIMMKYIATAMFLSDYILPSLKSNYIGIDFDVLLLTSSDLESSTMIIFSSLISM